MKLINELKDCEQRFEAIGEDEVNIALKELIKSKQYRCLETRFVWALFHHCYTSSEISELYDKYNSNDKHIDTLIKRAFKNVYKNVTFNLKD